MPCSRPFDILKGPPPSPLISPAPPPAPSSFGISDYKDDKIPDLRFAHRDADAPAFWLQSPAGGRMAPENINQFNNGMATAARFAADTGRTAFKKSEKQGTSECH